jgi:tRNA 2-thiouridine synthesizing protein E
MTDRNDEGFLTDASAWTEDIARDIAKELNIELTPKHWEIITFLRAQHFAGVEMTIRKMASAGIVDLKTFYHTFPGGPLKNSSKIAGLPRPTTCL